MKYVQKNIVKIFRVCFLDKLLSSLKIIKPQVNVLPKKILRPDPSNSIP